VTWLAYRYLRLKGWTFLGSLPNVDKMIVIGAPHTTNWDFVAFLAARWAFKMEARFLAKRGLFRWPFGYFFTALGGIPVGRSKQGGVVGQVAEVFDEAEHITLVIAPEGTRAAVPYWKSGFLKIAEATSAPIVLAAVDFSRRELTIGPAIDYRGDVSAFMDQVRAFYDNKEGLRPALKGPVRVLDES
jgi:1-acyl-sn-glycerol-3-phosphate acyltransferase